MSLFVGCAGWALPTSMAAEFPGDGTHLERYARRFNAVEINSSFYRPHQHKTYARWAASVPSEFRFAVKMPKAITHTRRLLGAREHVRVFLEEISGLGEKLGVLLVQLPPSLDFEPRPAAAFLKPLRAVFTRPIALEARHPTWFRPTALRLLGECDIAQVAADPAPVPAAACPAGSRKIVYYRWHGSPRMYYSAYSDESLHKLVEEAAAWNDQGSQAWCIFDNTAEGAALPNALEVRRLSCQILSDVRRGPFSAGSICFYPAERE